MKHTILALVCLAAATSAVAQEGWLIPFAAAYQPDVKGFNSAFADNRLPQAGERQYGWGIELRSLVGGSFLVGPMFFRTWDDASNDSFQLNTTATAILGELGFKIAPFDFLTIIPMVGVGAVDQSFNIRTRSEDITLEELLSSPGRNASISSGMKLAGLAALELGLSVGTSSGHYGLALRGGYLYSPLAPGWHLSNGARLTESPDSRLGGLFFSAGITLVPAAQTTTSGPGF
jgi:hypothetical protein